MTLTVLKVTPQKSQSPKARGNFRHVYHVRPNSGRTKSRHRKQARQCRAAAHSLDWHSVQCVHRIAKSKL